MNVFYALFVKSYVYSFNYYSSSDEFFHDASKNLIATITLDVTPRQEVKATLQTFETFADADSETQTAIRKNANDLDFLRDEAFLLLTEYVDIAQIIRDQSEEFGLNIFYCDVDY